MDLSATFKSVMQLGAEGALSYNIIVLCISRHGVL